MLVHAGDLLQYGSLDEMERGWGTRAYAERDAPWPMPGMTREEVVDWTLEWMHLSASRGDAVALTRMFYDLDVREVLGTIRVPTLVLSRGVGAMEEEARAFAALVDFVDWSHKALQTGGVWMALKGKHPQAELLALPPGIDVFHVEPIAVPGLKADRCIVWMRDRRA